MGGLVNAKSVYGRWFKKNENQNSLDYKLKISAKDIMNEVIPEGAGNRPPFFFGNMGPVYEANPKAISQTDSPITISIFTFNSITIEGETLINYIESVIHSFFLSHNFGTRQSKGYGSYYIHTDDPLYIEPNEIINDQNQDAVYFLPYSFPLAAVGNTAIRTALNMLKKMEIFYKAMRSGINQCFGANQHYLKSLFWIYFKRFVEINLKWEKKKIKDQFLAAHPFYTIQSGRHSGKPAYNNSPLGFSGSSDLLIKDLFGLATTEKWEAKWNFEIEKQITDVERFKSPIFFKPILTQQGYIIYFHAEELTDNNSIIRKTVTINAACSIPTPVSFDFHDFFDFLCNPAQFNLDSYFLADTGALDVNNRPEYMSVNQMLQNDMDNYNNIGNYQILREIFNNISKFNNAQP